MEKIKALPVPCKKKIAEFHRKTIKDKNIVGSYIGFKQKDGSQTRAISLVVLVKKKYLSHDKAIKFNIPKQWAWTVRPNGQICKIKTDVREINGSGIKKHSIEIAGPGDLLKAPIGASLGVVINHPHLGRVVTTAAHAVYKKKGEWEWGEGDYPVQIKSSPTAPDISGFVRKSVNNKNYDYALVSTEDPKQCFNLFRDKYEIKMPYDPDESDINNKLYVLSAAGVKPTKLIGINMTAPIGVAGQMVGLLVTTAVTRAGDSGGLLVDEQWRCLGIVIGVVEVGGVIYSVYASISSMIQNEGAIWV